MSKLFIYNFNGEIHETTEAFDETYRAMKKQAVANGESFNRQVVCGDKVINQHYNNGAWLDD